VEFLSLENQDKIGMHANCDTQPLIVYLRERMKKGTDTIKRYQRWVGEVFVEK